MSSLAASDACATDPMTGCQSYGPTQRGQRGDETALFERHAERLVKVVQGVLRVPRQIAEDACAIAWIQLLRKQPERDAIFAWLRVVAIREGIRLVKSEGRESVLDEDSAGAPGVYGDRRADLQLAAEVREAFGQISSLSDQQVRIFSLHVAGFSYDEISEMTGYSWTTVNRHMVRARSLLRAKRGS
jgi:RNA polymerase sigma factor (sigma-70 family)